ncbi:hypothetical protein [Motilimonas pumila]|uniref:Uncharacterized protein n=1 Tax=Motilimonas pumila TaxID=2303987 RepID=A0A418YG29_9GAMM|nr:hypothetical protein [Motilimonas pumila]RJG48427.1 hypothetical protein D1Z90_08000 [Motilimonas pumila]
MPSSITLTNTTTLEDIKQFADNFQDANHQARTQDKVTQPTITVYEKVGQEPKFKSQGTINQRIDNGRDAMLKLIKSKLDNPVHRQMIEQVFNNVKGDGVPKGSMTGNNLSMVIGEAIMFKNNEAIEDFLPGSNNFSTLNGAYGLTDSQKESIQQDMFSIIERSPYTHQNVLDQNELTQLAQMAVDNFIAKRDAANDTINNFFSGTNGEGMSGLTGYDMLSKDDIAGVEKEVRAALTSAERFGLDELTPDEVKQMVKDKLDTLKDNLQTTTTHLNNYFSNTGSPNFSELEGTDNFNSELKTWLKDSVMSDFDIKAGALSQEQIGELIEQKVATFNGHLSTNLTILDANAAKLIVDNTSMVEHQNYTVTQQDKIDKLFPQDVDEVECPVSDIDSDDLNSSHLTPKFSMTMENGKTLAMTEPFEIKPGRTGCLAYIEGESGKYELHGFYLSNSRGEWQSPSHFGDSTNLTFLGKGVGGGKSSTVLPMSVQKEMHAILNSMPPRQIEGDSQQIKYGGKDDMNNDKEVTLSRGGQMFFGSLQFLDNSEFTSQVDTDHTGKPIIPNEESILENINKFDRGDVGLNHNIDSIKEQLALVSVPDGLEPNFHDLIERYPVTLSSEYPQGGEAFIFQGDTATVNDQDVCLKYMFIRDNETGGVFLAGIENTLADINSFGVRNSSFNIGILGTGLVEYETMLPEPFKDNPDIAQSGRRGFSPEMLQLMMMGGDLNSIDSNESEQDSNSSSDTYKRVEQLHENMPLIEQASIAIGLFFDD